MFKNVVFVIGFILIEILGFKYFKCVINFIGVLSLFEIFKKFVVIGGGYIGMELGIVYVNFGIEVIVVEVGDEILVGFEKVMSFVVKCVL